MSRYWITPPELYKELDKEFHFDYDPCPNPRPDGFNSLVIPWGSSNYCNPPFRKTDGNTDGPTAFVRKAILEQAKGNSTVLLIPAQSYINLLLEAGAELRSAGRTKFLEVDTGEPLKGPSPTILAILRGNPSHKGIGAGDYYEGLVEGEHVGIKIVLDWIQDDCEHDRINGPRYNCYKCFDELKEWGLRHKAI